MSPNPPPCCVPSRHRLAQLTASTQASVNCPRATAGSLETMVRLEGRFHMGSEAPEAFPTDGEGPVRQVTLTAFYISKYAVTNEQFAEFVRNTGYRTEAGRFGWSFVFRNHIPEPQRGPAMPGTPWWVRVDGADWSHPEGPDTSVIHRSHHPVVPPILERCAGLLRLGWVPPANRGRVGIYRARRPPPADLPMG